MTATHTRCEREGIWELLVARATLTGTDTVQEEKEARLRVGVPRPTAEARSPVLEAEVKEPMGVDQARARAGVHAHA